MNGYAKPAPAPLGWPASETGGTPWHQTGAGLAHAVSARSRFVRGGWFVLCVRGLAGEVSGGTVCRAGMGIAAGGGQAGVADGLLHEVGGGAMVEGMGDMGVAQPVG